MGKIYEAINSGVNVKLNLVGAAKVTSRDLTMRGASQSALVFDIGA